MNSVYTSALSLFLNRDKFNKYSGLVDKNLQHLPEDFVKVYKILKVFYSKYDTIKHITLDVFQKLLNDKNIDVKLPSISIDDEPIITEEFINDIKRKRLNSFIYDAFTELNANKEIDLEKYEREIKSIINITYSNEGIDYFDISRFEEIQNYHNSFYPTGIKKLDNILRGGLRKKELVFFVAPSKAGKTWVLVNITKNLISNGVNVIYYTLEINKNLIALRLDQSMLGVTFDYIINNIEEVKNRLRGIKNTMGKLLIKEYPAKTASVSDIKSHIVQTTENVFKPDVIVIDYADLLKTLSNKSRYEELGDIFATIRGMASELDISILTVTQTNRQGFNKDAPDIADIADSIDKVRHADAVFTFNKLEDSINGDGICTFKFHPVAIRNNYSGGEFNIKFDFNKGSIVEEYDQDIPF